MSVFYSRDLGGHPVVGVSDTLPSGAVEITEAEYTDVVAAAEAAQQAAQDAGDAAALANAQAVYDEIVSIHPITALALAKLLHPGFEP